MRLTEFTVADSIINIQNVAFFDKAWAAFANKQYSDYRDISVKCLSQGDILNGVEFLSPSYRDHILKNESAVLFANADWTKADLYAEEYEQASGLLILLLYSYLSTRRTLLVHSSLVDYNGSGVLFLGPSGIGKTTQAELWNQYLGADILNGDMVFIRENEDGFYGYGSPWHGSSPYCLNQKVKLKAMVSLSQAPDNTLRPMSGMQDLNEVMRQIFLPHWDEAGTDACLTTLDDLLQQVPVYHLACRPDEDAVLLLKNELQL